MGDCKSAQFQNRFTSVAINVRIASNMHVFFFSFIISACAVSIVSYAERYCLFVK